jgi:tRNA(fMet)-specific endonuclease VapC
VSAVVADTSVWVELLAGRSAPGLVEALRQGLVVLPPIVVAELISGARRARDRASIHDLMEELPLHETPLDHWIRVGDLRRRLAERGVSVSTPDAHVAQCALDRGAVLLSRDAVFARIAEASDLMLRPG